MSAELTPEQEKQVQERTEEAILVTNARTLKIMKDHFGEEAYHVLVKAIGEDTRLQWSKAAEENEDKSIEAFINLQFKQSLGNGTTMEKTETGFQMNCVKCPAYEIAKRYGLEEQMFYMCCEPDPFAAEGYNPNIGFKRTKTLMQGDDYCDHFYYYKN